MAEIIDRRKHTAKLRISPRKRRFVIDVVMHDIELEKIGVSGQERKMSIKRFIKTFDGETSNV
jgi:hypothetical protein